MVYYKSFISVLALTAAAAQDCNLRLEHPAALDMQPEVSGDISLNDGNVIVQADGSPVDGCNIMKAQWVSESGEYKDTFLTDDGQYLPVSQVFYTLSNKLMRRTIQDNWSGIPAIVAGRLLFFQVKCAYDVYGCLKINIKDMEKPLKWGYHSNGYIAPEDWEKEFPDCKGKKQSPIDLPPLPFPADKISPFHFHGTCEYAQLIYHEGNVEWSVEASHTGKESTCAAGVYTNKDEHYELIQFHLHYPSEHTIEGRFSDLEIHFVHKHEAGDFMVIGIMLDVVDGAGNNTLVQDLFSSFEDQAVFPIHPVYNDFIINKSQFYNYPGSFTTPPCTEAVNWWVRRESVAISAAQFERMKTWLKTLPAADEGRNNRPVQPYHGRLINLV